MTSNAPRSADDTPDPLVPALAALSIRQIRSLDADTTAPITHRLVRHARDVVPTMGGHNAGGSGFEYSDTSSSAWRRTEVPPPDEPEPAVDLDGDTDASDTE